MLLVTPSPARPFPYTMYMCVATSCTSIDAIAGTGYFSNCSTSDLQSLPVPGHKHRRLQTVGTAVPGSSPPNETVTPFSRLVTPLASCGVV